MSKHDNEIERIGAVLKQEGEMDAENMGERLLGKVQPDVERKSEAEMVALARRNWHDAAWRQEVMMRMSSKQFLKLAQDVTGQPLPPELGGPKPTPMPPIPPMEVMR